MSEIHDPIAQSARRDDRSPGSHAALDAGLQQALPDTAADVRIAGHSTHPATVHDR